MSQFGHVKGPAMAARNCARLRPTQQSPPGYMRDASASVEVQHRVRSCGGRVKHACCVHCSCGPRHLIERNVGAVTFGPTEHRRQHEQLGQGFARSREDGEKIDLPKWTMLVKVAANDTLGRLTLIEGRMAPQLVGPPAHIHDGHDETFVVLEGRMRFRIGDGFHTAVPGETIFAGRRLAHGFSNPFDEAARYLVILTPSGYEDYFAKVSEHVGRTGEMPDPVRTQKLMAEHATVVAPVLADTEQ